ncbi:MAG: hypothetical protein WB772_16555, partial [Xanthobacteraceae bacterium]
MKLMRRTTPLRSSKQGNLQAGRILISGIVADVSLELLDRLSSQNRRDQSANQLAYFSIDRLEPYARGNAFRGLR